MFLHKTVNKKGAKTEKSRYTVVLALMADGKKLPPMIIFKRKTKPTGNFPKGVKTTNYNNLWRGIDSL